MELITPQVREFKLTKSKQKKYDEIKELGYATQNEELIKLGYQSMAQNKSYLNLFKGDVKLIVQALQQRAERKEIEKVEKAEKKKLNNDDDDEEKKISEKPAKTKKSPKEKKMKIPQTEVKEYTELPSHIKKIYLDGNNMLYAESAIRSLMLKRKNKEAEMAISDVAWAYMKKLGSIDIVLVYDRTSFNFTKETDSKHTLRVFSAGKYGNSDDALVDWADQIGKDSINSNLFVTSDRELQYRLTTKGSEEIMKPGKWFKLAETLLGAEEYKKTLPEKPVKKETEEKKNESAHSDEDTVFVTEIKKADL